MSKHRKPSIPTRQTTRPATRPTTEPLRRALGQAIALAALGEVEQAGECLRPLAGTGGASHGMLLVQAARLVAGEQPTTALALARESVRLDPDLAAGWMVIASILDRLGEHAEARAVCLRVVYEQGAPPEQVLNACNLLVRYGDERLALESAKRAFALMGRPLAAVDPLLYIALRLADWPMVDQLTAQLRAAHARGKGAVARESPRNNVLWCDDERTNIAVIERWSRRDMPTAAPPWRGPIEPLAGRRLRVGYLSSDFREHPGARLINGLFRHHDRSRFELFMYCSGWDDGSAIRRELESHMDHVHSVTKLSDQEAADLIRSHRIDVLVERNGPTRANRMSILTRRPAPVQIEYLGWSGSVGGRVVDYLVTDAYCVPPGVERLYPERLIRIADTYQVNDFAARIPPLALSRAQAGLPPRPTPVVGMFNAINKVRAEVWRVWMRILRMVPKAVLWVLDPGELAREHILAFTIQQDVDPQRIIWAPRVPQDLHLMRIQCCDLILDPWPYGGHTTTADALFLGIPHVTLEGRNFTGRVSGSLLHAAELGFLVQPDIDGYVEMASMMLNHPEQLAQIKRIILDNVMKTDVFNAQSKARQLEQAYTIALE
ncbi:MAG: glycosyl transferase family A, partial [Sphingobacteriia bacterium]|nr:glycosyl transferase family A [Sphingobacteriia bacterium]